MWIFNLSSYLSGPDKGKKLRYTFYYSNYQKKKLLESKVFI